MDYSGQVSDQKIDSIPATIKEPTLLDAQLPAELWDRITKATNSIEAQFNSYEDTAGNIYLMEQAIGGPGWLCKVYYVSDDNYQMVNVETNNVDCGGLYADNNGNWFLLNGGDLYKLEGAKALYIPSLHFNDLSYDSNTNTWYGRTIDTTNAPNDIYTYYKINFGDN